MTLVQQCKCTQCHWVVCLETVNRGNFVMSILPQLPTRTESLSRTPILCPARSKGRAFLSPKALVSGPNHRTLLSWTPTQQAPPLTPPCGSLLPTPHCCSPLVLEERSIKMPPHPH